MRTTSLKVDDHPLKSKFLLLYTMHSSRYVDTISPRKAQTQFKTIAGWYFVSVFMTP